MNWIALLAASVVLKSGGMIFRRRLLGKRNSADPYVSAIFFNLVSGLLLLLVAFILGFQTFDVTALWVWIALNIGAAVVADALQFNALKHIDAGNFAIIESTRIIWTIVAATMFLGETLTHPQIIAASFIFFATLCVLWQQRKTSKATLLGFLLAASFAAVYGLATIVDRVLFQAVNVISYLSVALIIQGFILAVLYRKRLKRINELMRKDNIVPFMGDVLFFIPSIVLLLEAVKRTDNISLLSALLPLSIILSVILGALFLNERKHLFYKLIGAVLAAIGVTLFAIL